jgi:hypothetical protein
MAERKYKKGQKVRIKTLDELPVSSQRRSTSGIALAGQVGMIIEVGGGYVLLDIETHLASGVGGIANDEIEFYVDPATLTSFQVNVRGGHVYHVKCTDEAMKELAEFIGDDSLEDVKVIKAS